MKKTRFLAIALCFVLLTGCAAGSQKTAPAVSEDSPVTEPIATATDAPETEPIETEAPIEATTEAPAETPSEAPEAVVESIAFTGRFSDLGETIIGLVYNDPFSEGDPIPTVIWNEGEYDKLVIVPRYVGSRVCAYRAWYDDEGYLNTDETPVYETVAEDGCEIGASLERPEGGAAWYVSIELPNGRHAGMYLNYNGRYGTPLYEFLQEPYLSSLITVPTAMEDWAPQMDMIGYESFWGFWRAATRMGLDTWEAAKTCYTALTEIGDGAAYTVTEGGDVENGVLTLKTARFHTAYDTQEGTLDERTAAQAALYAQIGNERGILGPDRPSSGEPLVYRLTGLTVYNPSLAAAKVQITVNGADCGTFELTKGDFYTLIPLDLEEVSAETPITVEVQITETNYGIPEAAIIEVFPGLTGNISGAV